MAEDTVGLTAYNGNTGNTHSLDFWKFWLGQTVSNLGSSFTVFALPLLIFTLTHSALALAVGTAMAGLPYPLFGLFLGAWVDRVNRKRLMVLADVGRAALIASVPLLAFLGLLSVWWIYGVSFFSACLSICFDAGEFAAIPSLVSQDHLLAANGRIQAGYAGASIVGPLLAGAFVAVAPLPSLFAIDAASFLLSALSLGLVRRSFNATNATKSSRTHAHLLRDVREGMRAVWNHPVLRSISLMMALVNMVVATRTAQLVLFASGPLHANKSQVAWLYTGGSVGAVALSLLAGPLRKRWSMGAVALGALTLSGLLTVVFALVPWYWPDVVVWGLITGLSTLFNITTASLRQTIVPNALLGRIMSIASVVAWSGSLVGALAGGVLIQITGDAVLAYVMIGVLMVLIPLGFAFGPIGQVERSGSKIPVIRT